MRFFRVGLPALTGIVLLFIAVQSIRAALGDAGAPTIDAVHTWLPPASFAIGLLLSALAISRRTRSGYFLGVGLSVLMVLGGLALIVTEVPYLARGGLGAALGAGVVILASIWILAWAVHGISMRRARTSFATTWQPDDRRSGIVLGSLAAFTAAAYLALGFVITDAATTGESNRADADALVAGTSIEARVIDATFQSVGDSAPEVSHLTLELSFLASPAYHLASIPTVCLADAATARDPAFKPDVYCWGTRGPALILADGFSDLTMPSSARVVRLELDRGGSLCPFGAGEWDALVQLAPLVADTSTGNGLEAFTRTASFTLETGEAPPPSGTAVVSSCLASTVSP